MNQSEIKHVLSPSMRESGNRKKGMMHNSLVLRKNFEREKFSNFCFQTSNQQKITGERKIFKHVVEFRLPTDSKQFNTTPKNYKNDDTGKT